MSSIGRHNGHAAWTTALVLFCAAAGVQSRAAIAHAAPPELPAAAPDAAAIAEGRAHFKSAGEHYRAGRYREALHELELADRRVPSPELWFNMARALEQLGELKAAIEQYERYLAARTAAADAETVRARIAALRAGADEQPQAAIDRRAALRIDCDVPRARVRLDGEPLASAEGDAPIERLLWIEPGAHVLEADAPGRAPFRGELTATDRSMVAATIAMPMRSSAIGRERRDDPKAGIATWIAASVAGAALITSTAARLSAESDRSAGELDSARVADRVSNVALATALTSGVVAIVCYSLTHLKHR